MTVKLVKCSILILWANKILNKRVNVLLAGRSADFDPPSILFFFMLAPDSVGGYSSYVPNRFAAAATHLSRSSFCNKHMEKNLDGRTLNNLFWSLSILIFLPYLNQTVNWFIHLNKFIHHKVRKAPSSTWKQLIRLIMMNYWNNRQLV